MAAKIYLDTRKHEDRNGTDAFIKIKEAAKLVGRPEVSVYYAVKHGHIKHIKAPNIKGPYGFLYLVKREDVIKWASYQNKTCDSHEPGKGTVPAKAETNVGYLSSKEAAKLVGVSPSELRNAARNGEVKAMKRERNATARTHFFEFEEKDVREWAAKRRETANDVTEKPTAEKPIVEKLTDVEPVAEKPTAEASLESYSDEELVAALTDRIKAAFSNGYEKGAADGRLEMKAAILSAIEKL